MDSSFFVAKYEQEVVSIVDDLIQDFKEKNPASSHGDLKSKKYLLKNSSLIFILQSLAFNYMDGLKDTSIDKSKVWDELMDINYKHLARFRDHFDNLSQLFVKK